MKKYLALIFAILAFIIRFVYFWFLDEIYDSILIFFPIRTIIVLPLVSGAIWYAFSRIPKNCNWINITACVISVFALIMHFIIPFRLMKTKYDLKFHEKEMLEIIEKVKNDEFSHDELGNVDLPDNYKSLSNTGQVFVTKNDEEGQVIIFWIFRGMLSGSVELIYSTGGEKLIKDNETGIVSIEKLKENWYYVQTDY